MGGDAPAVALMRATALPEPPSERACKSCVAEAIRTIAAELRNTPAVCRKSYVNPLVFDAWRSGALHHALGDGAAPEARKAERLAAAFLRREMRRAGRVAVVRVVRPGSGPRIGGSIGRLSAATGKKRADASIRPK